MNRGKKVLAAMLALTLTATMFVGCGSKKEDTKSGDSKGGTKISLKVWGPAEEQNLLKELCEAFDEQETAYDITFDYGTVGEGDAATQITKDAKAAADVFMFAGDQIYTLAKGGYLYDLSPLETDLGLKVTGVFDENAVNGAKVDGKLYGVPFTPNLPILYYNKSLLTEEEVKSLDTIIAKDLGADVKNFGIALNNGFYNNAFFNGVGCTVFGANGTTATECDWNNANGLAVVKYLNSTVATGKVHLNADNDHLTLMKDGKLASVVTGTWDGETLKTALGANYAATVLPNFKVGGKDYTMKTYGSYKQFGVNAQTAQPEAAAKLAYFLANKDCQTKRLEQRGSVPTLIELASGTYEDPAVKAVIQQATADHSVIQPTIDQMQKFWSPAEDLGNKIWKKDKAVQTDAEIQKTLDTLVSSVTAQ